MVRRLLLLNGLAVIGAVLYHASGWGFTAMFWWTDRYAAVSVPDFSQMGSIPYYGLRLVVQLIIFSIPAFLFVSGFFTAFATGRDQLTVSWKVIGTRIKNLAIPYLLWTGAIIVTNVLAGQLYTPARLFQEIVFGKAAPPYYYVPLIIQLYLLSPFLIRFARTHVRALLIIAAILQFSVQTIKYVELLGVNLPSSNLLQIFTASWFFPGHIFWYVFGITVKFNLPSMKKWLDKYKWVFLGLLIVLIPIGMFEWEVILHASEVGWLAHQRTLINELYSLMFLLCFLAFEWFPIPPSKRINALGPKSFGVYLAHSPVLQYASRGMYHLTPWILGVQILFQPILLILGIGVPLLLMKIVEHSPARRFYAYIFG